MRSLRPKPVCWANHGAVDEPSDRAAPQASARLHSAFVHEGEHDVDARRLHERGERWEVVAERLLVERHPADWAVPVLRRAADAAARSGDFDRAVTFLLLALESMPSEANLRRVLVLIELGRVEAASGRSDAHLRWQSADDHLQQLDAVERIRALAELGDATYSSGLLMQARQHFQAAYELFDDRRGDPTIDEVTKARVVVGLSSASLLTGHRHRGVVDRLRSLIDRPPTFPDLPTRALMASAAGEVALGVDRSVDVTHQLIDAALGNDPHTTTVFRPAVESLSAAMSLTGRPDAAISLLDARLDQAVADNDLVAHVSLLPLRAHASLLADRLEEARRDALDALDLIDAHPGASGVAEAPARYVLTVVLVELDDDAAAERACDVEGHAVRWGSTPMHGWFLDGLARVHAAAHRHDEAIEAWQTAARAFTAAGGSGGMCEWRDGLARSLAAVGEREHALHVSSEQLTLADAFGDRRMLAIAQSTCAALDNDHTRAAARLSAALDLLGPGTAELTRCQLALERGTRLRRAGRRRTARDQLATGQVIADRVGARRLARLLGEELAAAGGRSARPSGGSGDDALSHAERRIAELAAAGLSNSEIAQRRSVSRKTVEAQLTSVYRKLGVRGRQELVVRLGSQEGMK